VAILRKSTEVRVRNIIKERSQEKSELMKESFIVKQNSDIFFSMGTMRKLIDLISID
jgi:hypothetical protein